MQKCAHLVDLEKCCQTQLSNAYFLAKFRFDAAENEPAKNLQNFVQKMLVEFLRILLTLNSLDRLALGGALQKLEQAEGARPVHVAPAGLERHADFAALRDLGTYSVGDAEKAELIRPY